MRRKISTHAPAGGATSSLMLHHRVIFLFLLTPLREGRQGQQQRGKRSDGISTHAPAGGATAYLIPYWNGKQNHFYSRPCGRGDQGRERQRLDHRRISTHAPAGGATYVVYIIGHNVNISTHAPAGGATFWLLSEPVKMPLFLLTPLREGRHFDLLADELPGLISTHAPAGGATQSPLFWQFSHFNFYSRPCGRGDRFDCFTGTLVNISTHAPAGGATWSLLCRLHDLVPISTHAPAGGATCVMREINAITEISTHAPAGGATAIFHKSVMRFCGKLPKDDTVLCLASFGFPRRDPKAVYLAWISCANLPQKCVREGLALKDQGTSCFHEGLASHAFDPVLV